MTNVTPNDVKTMIILPLATLYHRPKQVETEAQGKLYLDELVASVVGTKCDRATLLGAWDRLKASWQFGWWPTPQAVVSAVLDAQREANEKARIVGTKPTNAPQLTHERNAKLRARAVFSDPTGRQMLEDDLGKVLFESFIVPGIVTGPHDLTPEIIEKCTRIRGKFMLSLRDGEAFVAQTGSAWMAAVVNWMYASIERNEKLKAEYLDGYKPQSFRRVGVKDHAAPAGAADVTPRYVRAHPPRAASAVIADDPVEATAVLPDGRPEPPPIDPGYEDVFA